LTLRVLIVEKHGLLAWDLAYCVADLGHAVVAEAKSAQEALEAAAGLRPDLVVMGTELDGDGDGISCASRILHDLGIPSLFLASRSDPASMARAYLAQPLGVLRIPFTHAQLNCALQVALRALGRFQEPCQVEPAGQVARGGWPSCPGAITSACS
jgi:DNA-binding NarL/FixJ family response regulator